MANEKKGVASTSTAEPGADGGDGSMGNTEMRSLQQTVEELQRELEALKRRSGKLPLDIDTFPQIVTPLPPGPVRDVIERYITLKRVVHDPVPPWQYPGSVPVPPPAVRSQQEK